MVVEFVDGIKVMRLKDGAGCVATAEDVAMFRIWQTLTGGHAMRDAHPFCHHF